MSLNNFAVQFSEVRRLRFTASERFLGHKGTRARSTAQASDEVNASSSTETQTLIRKFLFRFFCSFGIFFCGVGDARFFFSSSSLTHTFCKDLHYFSRTSRQHLDLLWRKPCFCGVFPVRRTLAASQPPAGEVSRTPPPSLTPLLLSLYSVYEPRGFFSSVVALICYRTSCPRTI